MYVCMHLYVQSLVMTNRTDRDVSDSPLEEEKDKERTRGGQGQGNKAKEATLRKQGQGSKAKETKLRKLSEEDKAKETKPRKQSQGNKSKLLQDPCTCSAMEFLMRSMQQDVLLPPTNVCPCNLT